MMPDERLFDLGDVLSVTTGRLLADRGIGALYDVLGFLCDDRLWTHQLPRAFRVCQPHVLAQHPELADVDASNVNPDTWRAWLDEQRTRFGDTRALTPLPRGAWTYRDPCEEAAEMVGADRVLTVHPTPTAPEEAPET